MPPMMIYLKRKTKRCQVYTIDIKKRGRDLGETMGNNGDVHDLMRFDELITNHLGSKA